MTTTDRATLKRLSIRADALRRAMESVSSGTTPDHAKWMAFAQYAKNYDLLARAYITATGDRSINLYQVDKLGTGLNTVWPTQKQIFDTTYADVLGLCAILQEFDTGRSASISEIQDLISANLRRVIFERPQTEIHIQNAIESLLVGRGFQRSVNYERESGKFRFSGREFIPDFIFPAWDLAVEVKLVREKQHVSRCVEEMSADCAAYRSKYAEVLFCVYDLGEIRDVSEFSSGLEGNDGVRVVVVKH